MRSQPHKLIKRHDSVHSYSMGIVPLIITLVIIWFRYHYEFTDSHFKSRANRIANLIKKNTGILVLTTSIVLFEFIFLLVIVPRAHEGKPFGIFQSLMHADLQGQVLTGQPPEFDYANIYWVNLRGTHLEGANMMSTILKRADLSYADLRRSLLNYAELSGSNLSNANFQEASIIYANLKEVNLAYSNLARADLSFSDLRGSTLEYANLTDAFLLGANLQETFNLTHEQLSKVKTLFKARLDEELMEQIKEKYPHLLESPSFKK